jgi:hypothetical protein
MRSQQAGGGKFVTLDSRKQEAREAALELLSLNLSPRDIIAQGIDEAILIDLLGENFQIRSSTDRSYSDSASSPSRSQSTSVNKPTHLIDTSVSSQSFDSNVTLQSPPLSQGENLLFFQSGSEHNLSAAEDPHSLSIRSGSHNHLSPSTNTRADSGTFSRADMIKRRLAGLSKPTTPVSTVSGPFSRPSDNNVTNISAMAPKLSTEPSITAKAASQIQAKTAITEKLKARLEQLKRDQQASATKAVDASVERVFNDLDAIQADESKSTTPTTVQIGSVSQEPSVPSRYDKSPFPSTTATSAQTIGKRPTASDFDHQQLELLRKPTLSHRPEKLLVIDLSDDDDFMDDSASFASSSAPSKPFEASISRAATGMPADRDEIPLPDLAVQGSRFIRKVSTEVASPNGTLISRPVSRTGHSADQVLLLKQKEIEALRQQIKEMEEKKRNKPLSPTKGLDVKEAINYVAMQPNQKEIETDVDTDNSSSGLMQIPRSLSNDINPDEDLLVSQNGNSEQPSDFKNQDQEVFLSVESNRVVAEAAPLSPDGSLSQADMSFGSPDSEYNVESDLESTAGSANSPVFDSVNTPEMASKDVEMTGVVSTILPPSKFEELDTEQSEGELKSVLPLQSEEQVMVDDVRRSSPASEKSKDEYLPTFISGFGSSKLPTVISDPFFKVGSPSGVPMSIIPTSESEKLDSLSHRFIPYESPLLQFSYYRLSSNFAMTNTNGSSDSLKSVSYSNKIDLKNTLCKFETAGGSCNDPSCDEQHFKDMAVSGAFNSSD